MTRTTAIAGVEKILALGVGRSSADPEFRSRFSFRAQNEIKRTVPLEVVCFKFSGRPTNWTTLELKLKQIIERVQ